MVLKSIELRHGHQFRKAAIKYVVADIREDACSTTFQMVMWM